MKLDPEIKSQLEQYLQLMEGEVHIKLSVGTDQVSQDMTDLLEEIAAMSSNIVVEKAELNRTPSFSINRPGEDTGISATDPHRNRAGPLALKRAVHRHVHDRLHCALPASLCETRFCWWISFAIAALKGRCCVKRCSKLAPSVSSLFS